MNNLLINSFNGSVNNKKQIKRNFNNLQSVKSIPTYNDTCSFSGNSNTPTNNIDDKNKKILIGSLAIGAAILMAVVAIKDHKKFNVKLGENASKESETAKKSQTFRSDRKQRSSSSDSYSGSRSSGSSNSRRSSSGSSSSGSSKSRGASSGSFGGSSFSYGQSHSHDYSSYDHYTGTYSHFTSFKEREDSLFTKFLDNFNNITENKSLESLKQSIMSLVKGEVDFESPSKIVEEHFNDRISNYKENDFINMYAFIKKQMPKIKDPVEAERSSYSCLPLLARLNLTSLDGAIGHPGFANSKYDFFKKKISEEVDNLLATNRINVSQSTKEKLYVGNGFASVYIPSYMLFCDNLNTVADRYLRDVIKKHIGSSALSDSEKKLLSEAENLNSKAIEIYKKLKNENEILEMNLGTTKKTISNIKSGKFKTGEDEFWEEYFNKYRSNNSYESKSHSEGSYQSTNGKSNNYNSESNSNNSGNDYKKTYNPYCATDREYASFNIFTKYGEDLGDINSLNEETLKKAYRRLAVKYHPDKNKTQNAQEIFQEINNANETLAKMIRSKQK